MRSLLVLAIVALTGCHSCGESSSAPPAAEQTQKDERPLVLREADGGRTFTIRPPPLVRIPDAAPKEP